MPNPGLPRQKGKAYDKDKVLQGLKEFFLLGYNREKACTLALFNPQTLGNWETKDASVTVLINSWIESGRQKARDNILKKVHAGDYEASKYYLDRRDEEFKPKSEAKTDNTTSISLDEKLKSILDNISKTPNGEG